MSKALYRKHRSVSLDTVVGQEHITALLKNALKSGRVAHAYLFTGPRGVGKTSIARILAYEINQIPYTEDAQHLDIIEIDAASNNGVEDVRDLREKVQIAPSLAKKKVYIIDEVHMLSKPAFNALLKTLEEPPEHVVFILATTDVNKLPATIISRTQHFGFRMIAADAVAAHLRTIADAENIAIEDDALLLIAKSGGGSFRDSISLLDQVSHLGDGKSAITAATIESSLGLAPEAYVETLVAAHQAADVREIATQIEALGAQGVNPRVLAGQLVDYVKSKVIETPALLPLLDALLEVEKSSHPSIKLLSVLAMTAVPKQSAVVAPPQQKPKNVALAAPKKPAPSIVKPVPVAAAPKKPSVPKKAAGSTEFDWQALLAHLKAEQHTALHSVLSKCTPELSGAELTLYTGSAFFKKKIDDTKYSTSLHESIQALGMPDLEIITVPEAAPLKDSQASAIADIMGGGVEVAVS